MFQKKLVAAGIALGLGMMASAQAAVFTFDPDGAGGAAAIHGAGIIDEAPGNSLAVGVGGGFATLPGTNFTLLYQANLGSIQASDTTGLFLNGTGGNFFTIVGAFPEVVTAGSATSADFGLGAVGPNVFNIYYNTTGVGNNLTGAGFTSATSVLSAHVIDSSGSFSFTANHAPPSSGCANTGLGFQQGLLDQGGGNGDNWAGQQTACGTGAADITLRIDSADAAFFPDLLSGSQLVLHLTNASLLDPFKQVDPSRSFNDGTGGTHATNLGGAGSINGVSCGASAPPCDFIFQSDANGSFVKVAIPEPATTGLFGLGLIALGWVSRKRAKR
jgi:hypothetical protein